ncbi:MAG TPA: hypothetical protein VFV73_06145 [Streptosporangiaceae bacterium]|nr:hypothetical protein [Streptosporangiaceae bacterium]
MRHRLEVRLAAGDVGRRVVIRKAAGELVTIPRDRALAVTTVPAVPQRRHREA